jgi:hypothetical protein
VFNRRGIALLLAAGFAALAMAPSAGAAATRAEYATEANAVCARYEDEGRKLLKELPRQPPLNGAKKGAGERFVKKFARFLGKIEELDAQTLAGVAAIAPAPGDEALVAEWITSLRRAIDLSKIMNRQSIRLMRLSYRLNASVRENSPGEGLTPKQRRLSRRLLRAFDQFDRVLAEAFAASDISDGLANQLGAIECVSGLEDQGTTAARASLLR